MPKLELHVHLDGAFDAQTLFDDAVERLEQLPDDIASKLRACTDAADFEALVSCRPTERSLAAMLDRFMFFLPIVQGRLDLVERLAHLFVQRQAEQNILYTEVRYSPHLLATETTYEAGGAAAHDSLARAREVVRAVTRGLRRGTEATGVEVTQILCLIDGRPEWAADVLELAREFRFEGPNQAKLCSVVGVDIAAGEAHFAAERDEEARRIPDQTEDALTLAPENGGGAQPPPNGTVHRAAFRRCAALGIPVTIHAGESGPAENVLRSTAAGYGGATRIGHGYALVEALSAEARTDPQAAARELSAMGLPKGVHFECCPTSSVATNGFSGRRWRDHPAAVLGRLRLAAQAAGDATSAAAIPTMSINSDDPSVFRVSLTDELQLAASSWAGLGLGLAGAAACTRSAVSASFLCPEAKSRLEARVEAALRFWEKSSGASSTGALAT